MPRRNPFQPKTAEEIKTELEEQQEIEKRVKKTLELGSKCLQDPKFKKYKDQTISQREWLIKKAEGYKNADPIEYAFIVSNILTQTAVLGVLIESVEKDASKGKK